MNISKKLEKWNSNKVFGVVNYSISYRHDSNIFIDLSSMCEDGWAYLELSKLSDEEFLKNNNISYIIKEGDIIPTGVVNFQSRMATNEIYLYVSSNSDLTTCNKMIKNLERAFEIQYEAEIFINSFKEDPKWISINK